LLAQAARRPVPAAYRQRLGGLNVEQGHIVTLVSIALWHMSMAADWRTIKPNREH
jgi:hypothetical protein